MAIFALLITPIALVCNVISQLPKGKANKDE